MDTLEVKKVTENKHDLSYFSNRGDDLYIVTTAYKSQNQKENGTSYFKVTDKGLVETYSIYNISAISDEMAVKEGTFLAICATDKDVVAEGNQLLYVKDGETTMIDQDYYYDLIGLLDGNLLYYKNDYFYGTFDENRKTFYLYDGKESKEAFDLDVGYFEYLMGYEYDGGILLQVEYECDTKLYKYDGKKVEEVQLPENLYHIVDFAVVENKAYISYTEGEESFTILGTVIDNLSAS